VQILNLRRIATSINIGDQTCAKIEREFRCGAKMGWPRAEWTIKDGGRTCLNKRKKVAWHKHLKAARKKDTKRRAAGK
jgi:hypothetical protein